MGKGAPVGVRVGSCPCLPLPTSNQGWGCLLCIPLRLLCGIFGKRVCNPETLVEGRPVCRVGRSCYEKKKFRAELAGPGGSRPYRTMPFVSRSLPRAKDRAKQGKR